jgi:hypothetical protein
MKVFWTVITLHLSASQLLGIICTRERFFIRSCEINLYLQKNYEKAYQIYDGLVQGRFSRSKSLVQFC